MHNLAAPIANMILMGFERHINLFIEITQSAKERFQQCKWSEIQEAAKERTTFYDARVEETYNVIRNDFCVKKLDSKLWQEVKSIYIDLLANHQQPELAETFYNSVFCHLFESEYYNNTYIFFQSTAHRLDDIETPKIYTSYKPEEKGSKETICEIMNAHKTTVPFRDLSSDVDVLINTFRRKAHKTRFKVEELQFDILNYTFYRNKGAYLIGRVISPGGVTPFIVAVLNDENGALYIDALLTDSASMAVVFGFARAYFFVDCLHPYALINFLKELIPHKTKADLYSAIGFHKQGKTQFYRDFLDHLNASEDKFELAAGDRKSVV